MTHERKGNVLIRQVTVGAHRPLKGFFVLIAYEAAN